jgi:hypothetical protein
MVVLGTSFSQDPVQRLSRCVSVVHGSVHHLDFPSLGIIFSLFFLFFTVTTAYGG